MTSWWPTSRGLPTKKTESEGAKTFQDFEVLVRDIQRFDSGSYTFRYPVNTKGQ